MIIKITNFTDGIHDLDFAGPVESVGLRDPFFGEYELKVKMDKSHSQIVLDCSLWVKAKFVCDRCSEEFVKVIDNDFKLTYMYAKEAASKNDNLNLYYITPETDKINLKEDIKEYALLSIPMKRLCKEECKGLCPRCGKNLNDGPCECKNDEINPIWNDLLKLKRDPDEDKDKNE